MPTELLANRMHWLTRLCVIPFMCLLCGGLMCTDLSEYVAEFVYIYIYIYNIYSLTQLYMMQVVYSMLYLQPISTSVT
jgi:hypothetical protein